MLDRKFGAVLVNDSNLTAATRYYPTVTGDIGRDVRLASTMTLRLVCTGGVTVTVEASVDDPDRDRILPGSMTWTDVTAKCVLKSSGAVGAASFVDTTDYLTLDVSEWSRVRVKVVTADGSNAVKLVELDGPNTATQTTLAAILAYLANLATGTLQTALNALVDETTGGSLAPSADGTLTKSDDTIYAPPLKVIWATGAGNLALMLADDTTAVVTIPVAANEKISCLRIKKVMAATTATGISGSK